MYDVVIIMIITINRKYCKIYDDHQIVVFTIIIAFTAYMTYVIG